MLRLVLVLLIAFFTSVIIAGSPKVIIDGNTDNSHVDSPANLPLGTALVLTCEVSGIPSGLTPNFTWTCPNEPCIQQGYEGREIRNNTLAINITSVRDNGTYTCTVSAEGCEVVSKDFHLKVTGTPNVMIDGYTVNRSFESQANLPLGTTLVLVCRFSGFSRSETPNITWMCPNKPCIQQGYAGRMIKNNFLAINITSVHDSGTYTCNVSAGECKGSGVFYLKITGGEVVHSYGRLILNEGVISDRRQLQPPNNPEGDGRIECRVSSGQAWFTYYGSYGKREDVDQTSDSSGSNATVVIKQKTLLSGNFAIEGDCNGLHHYLFLKNDTIPNDLKWKYPSITRSHSSITVDASELPNGTARFIIGYTRLDLGVPVEGEYVNLPECRSKTFSPLVPGAKYRITAWGLGGGFDEDRRRSQSPIMINESTLSQGASPPRHVTITRIFQDGIELNWMPPKEPNGDILCYNILYTMQNGTQQNVTTPYNINYHTLTGMVKGQNYFNISVVAFNGKPGEQIVIMTSYVHNPNTTLPCDVPGKISSLKITPIIINCSAGLLIEWEEPNSTSEIITYELRIHKVGKDMMGSLNTTKNYQLVSGLTTSTVYRVTVAAFYMGGRGDEAVDTVITLSALGNFDECPSIRIPNIVTFNSDSMIISESETVLRIDVYRYGQMEGLIKLSVKDQNGTAKRFEDYVLQSRYLYFIQTGQMVEKATVVVKIINDDKKENKEYFELILSNDSGDKNVMFRKKKMTIYIVNDDKYKKGK